MGDVIHADFSKGRQVLRLGDEIGQMAVEIVDEQARQRLVEFAKRGEPIADHSFNPDDCA